MNQWLKDYLDIKDDNLKTVWNDDNFYINSK